MAKNIKGPAIYLAQFAGDEKPFNSWNEICKWAASLGYKGVQVPTWDKRMIDLEKAAGSRAYWDEYKGAAKEHGVEITELASHITGHMVAVNPVYHAAFDSFVPAPLKGKPKQWQEWAAG